MCTVMNGDEHLGEIHLTVNLLISDANGLSLLQFLLTYFTFSLFPLLTAFFEAFLFQAFIETFQLIGAQVIIFKSLDRALYENVLQYVSICKEYHRAMVSSKEAQHSESLPFLQGTRGTTSSGNQNFELPSAFCESQCYTSICFLSPSFE